MINDDNKHILSGKCNRHDDTIPQNIPGFTFPNGLLEEMSSFKPRLEHKGILETTGEDSGVGSPLLTNVGRG